jgi:hypothetical protein
VANQLNGQLKAAHVKEAIRRRHPAIAQFGGPGAWTTVEEWEGIDVLALSAWSSAKPPIVGYEIKVSRGDYRREILKPSKRARAVAMCWQFYLAVPKGLLKKEERDYVQPEHFKGNAFVREKCPEHCRAPSREGWSGDPETQKWGKWVEVPAAYGDAACRVKTFRYGAWEQGEEFNPSEMQFRAGGPHRKSVVEVEAPTLWIPPVVGLVEVEERRDGLCLRTVRKAPLVAPTQALGDVGRLTRWVSFRPDPRHDEERERQRKALGL